MSAKLLFALVLLLTAPVFAEHENAVVYGTVFDAAGNPMAGVTVTLENPALAFRRGTTTGSDGSYNFAAVPPAEGYKLTAAKGGKKLDIRTGITLNVGDERVIMPPLKEQAEGAPTLVLFVQPANVQVYGDDVFKGMTSAEGRLVVDGLAPGSHRVRMNLIGYTESARTLELKPGETFTIEAKLEPAGPKPLALSEIEEALANGLPPKGITKLVNQYGVDFGLTKEIEQRLRGKGADDALLVAIATNRK